MTNEEALLITVKSFVYSDAPSGMDVCHACLVAISPIFMEAFLMTGLLLLITDRGVR